MGIIGEEELGYSPWSLTRIGGEELGYSPWSFTRIGVGELGYSPWSLTRIGEEELGYPPWSFTRISALRAGYLHSYGPPEQQYVHSRRLMNESRLTTLPIANSASTAKPRVGGAQRGDPHLNEIQDISRVVPD